MQDSLRATLTMIAIGEAYGGLANAALKARMAKAVIEGIEQDALAGLARGIATAERDNDPDAANAYRDAINDLALFFTEVRRP